MAYHSRINRWLSSLYRKVLTSQRCSVRLARRGDINTRPITCRLETLESRVLLSASFDLSSLLTAEGGDGTLGFIVEGINEDDRSGYSASGAGDINGDGFDDLIIGASLGDAGGDASGESYVVFGKATGFPAQLALTSLSATDGFVINGIDAGDQSGISVSGAGDVNGDGIDDLIVGAQFADRAGVGGDEAGESYVIFGDSSLSVLGSFDLSSLLSGNGSAGFVIRGIVGGDLSGRSVSTAGDVNGDGFADLLIGAIGADPDGDVFAGQSYVVFGDDGAFAAEIELSSLNQNTGIVINGIDQTDTSGFSVSGAGDVNGDGIGDLIIGASQADSNNNDISGAGESYVVLGQPGGFAAPIELSSLNGASGFIINGIDINDFSGTSVSAAGDVNGDGIDDLIVGASLADPNSNNEAGEVYVVLGQAGGFTSPLELSTLGGSTGFIIEGVSGDDLTGVSVSSAGDFNGDGIDDIIIGARGVSTVASDAGASYVIFGQTTLPTSPLVLSSLNGTNGFVINGIDENDFSGTSVSSAGDVNGDGYDDLIIGADGADRGVDLAIGESYVLFGSDYTSAVTQEGTSADETLPGGGGRDILIGGQGNDLLIGNGGTDVLRGGEGNDVLAIGDLSFDRLAGGNGVDTVRLDGAGPTLDLTAASGSSMTGIEQIDITGSGANVLSLSLLSVLNLSDHSNTLTVFGDSNDTVGLGGGWTSAGTTTIDSQLFDVFTQGAATLNVADGVSTTDTAVIDRHVFYNSSVFDGNGAAVGAADGNAIASDKDPLLPNGIASFANYTSYSRGINGIMIDIANLPSAGPDLVAGDFVIKMGNDNDPSNWATANGTPTINTRRGEGPGGSDRIAITWPDNTIQEPWLEVTVLGNANTGLGSDDVFYFGNAIGETGNNAANAVVDVDDIIGVRSNASAIGTTVGVENDFDFNRDSKVNLFDLIVARDNASSVVGALQLIDLTPVAPAPQSAPAFSSAPSPDATESASSLQSSAFSLWLEDQQTNDTTDLEDKPWALEVIPETDLLS